MFAVLLLATPTRPAAAQARSPAGAPPDSEGDYASLSELLTRRGAGEFSAHAEAGAGLVLSAQQRERLGYETLAQGSARLGLGLSEALSAQLSAGSVVFFADSGSNGQAYALLQGIRFNRPFAQLGCAFADFNFGVVESVRRARVGLDAGIGFEFPILAYVELGPFVRYHHVFAATPDATGDARFVSLGIAGSVRRIGRPRPERRGPSDSDGDGVLDRDDLCPRTPSEPEPDPQRPGCPAPDRDRDRDRIAEPLDACPEVAGVPSTDPKRHGCPALVEVERDRLKMLAPVFFATGEDRILPESAPLLFDIAEALRKNPALRVSIEGHTDDTGTDFENLELSKRRAESVRRALVELGIDGARLEARGFGRSRPLVPGTTAEAREKNRRVELIVLPGAGERPGQ